MNDDSLKKRLRNLEVPPCDPLASDQALYRAKLAFANRPGATQDSPRFAALLWRWGAGAVAAGLAIIATLLSLAPKENNPAPTTHLALLTQMEALFPGQLRAVIERDSEVGIELYEQPGPGSDQPVTVSFQKDGRIVNVLSYSGSKVCLQLAGREVCFEPLVNERGQVIVAGADFLWTDSAPVDVGGYRVSATLLAQAL